MRENRWRSQKVKWRRGREKRRNKLSRKGWHKVREEEKGRKGGKRK